jgi:hypothetical protein
MARKKKEEDAIEPQARAKKPTQRKAPAKKADDKAEAKPKRTTRAKKTAETPAAKPAPKKPAARKSAAKKAEETTEAKPKRATRAKKTAEPAAESPKKPAAKIRTTKKAEEAAEAKPKRASRAKKADEPALEAPKKPAAKKRTTKKADETTEAKPKRATRAKKAAEPEKDAAKKPAAKRRTTKKAEAPAKTEPESNDIEIKPIWRARKSEARAEKEAAAESGGVLRRRKSSARDTDRSKPAAKTPDSRKSSSKRAESTPAESKKAALKKRTAKKAASEPGPTIASFGYEPEANEIAPVLTWRSKSEQPTPEDDRPKQKAKAQDKPKRERAPKREAVEPEPEPVIETKIEEPTVQVREAVIPPIDAPHVIPHNGRAVMIHKKEVLPPFFFFGNAMSDKQLSTVLEEAKMAAEEGLSALSLLVELPVDKTLAKEAAETAGRLAKRAAEVVPDVKLVLRTVLTAPEDWKRKFPDSTFKLKNGATAEPSFCDDAYWKEAGEALEEFVFELKDQDPAGHIIGIHLDRGEWFFAEGWGYDTSKASAAKFQNWLKHRYSGDVVSLRAAWFDGKVTFDSAEIPEFQAAGDAAEFVRTDRRARKYVDCHLFMSDVAMERIADLAHTVKKTSKGNLMVGVSYGYTFEWSHPGSGHLALGKLLRCPDVDYIGGPPSYKSREPGQAAHFPWPIDSFALNGKLCISEEDYKTSISGAGEPDDYNPVMRTPQALESSHWRGAGAALAHSSGLCWMDTWGSGWLSSRGIWERGGEINRSLQQMLTTEQKAPDAALFIDERSLAYLVDERAFTALIQNVRESLSRSGLSVGLYLLSDLAHRENFPESRLYIFVNAWDIRPEVRSAIKSRVQRDGKVMLWLYSAGLFEGGRESLERVREASGIALRPQPFNSKSGTTLLDPRHPLCMSLPREKVLEGGQLEPSYFAIPEDAAILGCYSSTGLPSFVVKTHDEPKPEDSWSSVFLGEPIVSPTFFRELGRMAGAHIWSHDDDVIHAREPYLTIHCTGSGERVIALPDNWVAYCLDNQQWASVEGSRLRFHGLDGTTHVFMVGIRSEIEAILNSKGTIKLTEEEVVRQREDTVHWDTIRLDVPVMKLDEWVEEGWSDELADDLMLRPSMLEVTEAAPEEDDEPEADQSRGRRRRKRRRRESRSQGQRGGNMDPDSGVSVLFRKRD